MTTKAVYFSLLAARRAEEAARLLRDVIRDDADNDADVALAIQKIVDAAVLEAVERALGGR